MPSLSNLTTKQKVAIGLTFFALVVIIVFTVAYLVTHPVMARVTRDLLIIVLAIELLILNIAVLVMLWQTIKLLDYLVNELTPVIKDLQETVGTVRGTTTFVSENVVNPTIEVASKAAGVRRSLQVLFSGPGSSRTTGQRKPPTSGGS
jgi:hypothetical protein